MIGTYLVQVLPERFATKTLVVMTAAVTALTFYCITLSLGDWNIGVCYGVASVCSGLGNGLAFGITFQLFP